MHCPFAGAFYSREECDALVQRAAAASAAAISEAMAKSAAQQHDVITTLSANVDNLRARLAADDAARAAAQARELQQAASGMASDGFSTPKVVAAAMAQAQVATGISGQISSMSPVITTGATSQPPPTPANSAITQRGALLGAPHRLSGSVSQRPLTDQERHRARASRELASIRLAFRRGHISPQDLPQDPLPCEVERWRRPPSVSHAPVLTFHNSTPTTMSPPVAQDPEEPVMNSQMSTGVASYDSGYAEWCAYKGSQ